MTPATRNKLTPAEAARLAELLPIIERGINSFVEVGRALIEVSDRRLYRETHATFEEFCQDKYSMTAGQAYRLCAAAETVKMLPSGQQKLIQNERQARELAKAPTADRPKILRAAARKGPVTAKSIKEETLRITRNSDDEALEAAIARQFTQPKSPTTITGSNEQKGSEMPAEPGEIPGSATMTEADLPSICKDLRDIAEELEAFPDFGDVANRLVLIAKWVRMIGNIK